MTAGYFKYWGKARQGDEPSGPRYHLLPYHCLDVAAVGHILLKQNQSYCENLTRLTGLSSQQFIPWYTFLLALHDIGKFADSFQNLNPDVLQTLQGRISDRQYGLRHDSLLVHSGSSKTDAGSAISPGVSAVSLASFLEDISAANRR